MKSTIAIALASVLLAACAPDADTPMHKQPPQVTSNPRIQVTRVGVIEDRLAYNERRGLYIIKDTVEVIADAGGPLKAGVVFTVTSEGAMQTKTFDIFFQDKPGAGAIGFSDEAVVAILCHRMRLKHAETGNDQWLTAAKYLEDVEESIQVAMKA